MSVTSTVTKILVIEDEDSVRAAIEAGLEVIGGYEVHTAPDADSGMRTLLEVAPDILLIDLVMPVTDGLEFLRNIGSDAEIMRPGKVVLMTALENPVPEGSLGDLGIDLVLPKPFRLNELASAVGAESPF